MIIQNVLWPKADVCTQEEMYFRKNKFATRINQTFTLDKHGKISSDTYFNSVSVDKWKKYTDVSTVSLILKIKGQCCIRLHYKKKIHDKIYEKCVFEQVYQMDDVSEIALEFPAGEGMAYFSVEASENACAFYGGYYSTDLKEEYASPVKIGIGICTFKRESFIEHNLHILNKYILNNPSSELYGHLEIFISDNGKTLDMNKLSSAHIHIVQNKNTGGAGGFTRDLIEILDANNAGMEITHVLLMDDDIVIDPESLLKTYRILSVLKEKFKDSFIGGAMLRNDAQNIQVESGASWNAGKLISLKSGLDMNSCDACLYNEVEEYREYNAWWYCCFPVKVVSETNLPMPIFIRGDDLEYGLRNMKNLILMNGICVWHEPFENKYSSFLSYYILRNQFIDNALHFPEYNKRDAKKQLMLSVVREVFHYRYKNVDLLLRGVKDYLAGIDWLINSDGESLHKEIMAAGYKALPIDEVDMPFSYPNYEYSCLENDSKLHRILRLVTFNGYLLPTRRDNIAPMASIRPFNAYRVKRILNYDVASQKGFITERNTKLAVKNLLATFAVIREIDRKYEKVTREYRKRCGEVQNLEFWKKYLNI